MTARARRIPGGQVPQAIEQRMTLAELRRFLRKVRMVGDCWVWRRYTDDKGYPQFRLPDRAYWAHRLSYATFVGPIPEGMTVNHKRECLNPSCVNPDHLELMTIAENTAEANRRRGGK